MSSLWTRRGFLQWVLGGVSAGLSGFAWLDKRGTTRRSTPVEDSPVAYMPADKAVTSGGNCEPRGGRELHPTGVMMRSAEVPPRQMVCGQGLPPIPTRPFEEEDLFRPHELAG